MKPNMNIAENQIHRNVAVFHDIASGEYGIRESFTEIRDGVFLEATKSISMTHEQLEKLLDGAQEFIKRRKACK